MKKWIKKKGKRKYKYVNGVKGMVTIFLVLILTPMLSIALALVEADRYQSVEEMMKEVVDGSANSTLADYDVYLRDRFGLSAVTQEREAADVFESYLNENIKTLGKAAVLTSSSATGALPLEEPGVLRSQVLETAKVSVVTEMEENHFPISQIVSDATLRDKIRKVLDCERIYNEIDYVDSNSMLTSDEYNLIDSINNYRSDYVPLDAYIDAYQDYYDDLDEDIGSLVAQYWDGAEPEDVQDLLDEIDESILNIVEVLQNILDTMKDVDDDLKFIVEDGDAFKEDVDNTVIADGSFCKNLYVYFKEIADNYHNMKNKWEDDGYRDIINNLINDVETELNKFKNLHASDIDSSWIVNEDEDDDDVEYNRFQSNYVRDIMNFRYFGTIMEDLEEFVEGVVISTKPVNGCAPTINGLANVVTALNQQNQVFDATLNASVSPVAMANVSAISDGEETIIPDCGTDDLCDKAVDFSAVLSRPINKTTLINVLDKMHDFLESYSSFLLVMDNFQTVCLSCLDDFLENTATEEYGKMINMFGYGIYNLPNRTTYDCESSLMDYDFREVFSLAGGSGSRNLMTSMRQCGNGYFTDYQGGGGGNTMFKGAEAEYLLYGSYNEQVNQAAVFMKIFWLRFVSNYLGTFNINGANQQCTASETYAMFTQSLLSVGESIADTIILVNGDNATKQSNCYEYLSKDTYYLAPGGGDILKGDLSACANGSSIVSSIGSHIDSATSSFTSSAPVGKSGTLQMRYDETMLFLGLAGVSQSTFENRMQNIIKSEAYTYYQNLGTCTFDLAKTYTSINSTAEYEMNSMFDGPGLTAGGLFHGDVKQSVGY